MLISPYSCQKRHNRIKHLFQLKCDHWFFHETAFGKRILTAQRKDDSTLVCSWTLLRTPNEFFPVSSHFHLEVKQNHHSRTFTKPHAAQNFSNLSLRPNLQMHVSFRWAWSGRAKVWVQTFCLPSTFDEVKLVDRSKGCTCTAHTLVDRQVLAALFLSHTHPHRLLSNRALPELFSTA